MPATNKITTDLTPVPSRAAPSTFSERMDALLSKLPTWAAQANALADEADANADTATAQAGIAAAQAEIATTKASEAANSAASALAAPGTSATSTTSLTIGTGPKTLTIQTGKMFSVGQSVVIADTANPAGNYMWGIISSHDSATGALTVNVAEINGTGTKTDWTVSLSANPATGSVPIFRSARTSNTILDAADRGKLIDITSGTFTQTFAAASALGDGWFCYLRNSGTGFIALDPKDSESIDGIVSYYLNPGEVRLIQSDGVSLRSIAITLSGYQEFTSSQTWTKPPGISQVYVEAIGGGGGGGSGSASYGGGGGAFANGVFNASVIGGTVSVVVGAGGAGGINGVNSGLGGNGGDSSFLTLKARGGSAGADSTSFNAFYTVGKGGDGTIGGAASSEFFGGGGYGSGSGGKNGKSGDSLMGGAGGAGVSGGAGISVNAGSGGIIGANGGYPGGGGGAHSTSSGGAGGNGRVRIWWR